MVPSDRATMSGALPPSFDVFGVADAVSTGEGPAEATRSDGGSTTCGRAGVGWLAARSDGGSTTNCCGADVGWLAAGWASVSGFAAAGPARTRASAAAQMVSAALRVGEEIGWCCMSVHLRGW